MIIEGDKDHELENIKNGHFKMLKLDKDECSSEFKAVNEGDYLLW